MPIASVLFANTAIWMMFVSLPMLLFGNLLIGLFEGLLLAWVFKVRWRRAAAFMIGANYVSMLAGLGLFGFSGFQGAMHFLWRPTIGDYREWFFFALGLAFALSILLEWPLCRLSFLPSKRSWKRSLLACSSLQVVSYLLFVAPILHWYEDITINEAAEVVPIVDLEGLDLPFQVYFIDPNDGNVYRMRPDGTEVKLALVADLAPGSRLALWSEEKSIAQGEKLDLCVVSQDEQSYWPFDEEFAPSESAFIDPDLDEEFRPALGRTAFAADLRREDERRRFVRTDPLELEVAEEFQSDALDYRGLNHWIFAYNGQFRLMFRTTIGSWRVCNASILPGDLVIFEFGGQICALDLNQRKLALICMGYGPIVVRDEVVVEGEESDQFEDRAEKMHDAEDPEAAPGEDGDRADQLR